MSERRPPRGSSSRGSSGRSPAPRSRSNSSARGQGGARGPRRDDDRPPRRSYREDDRPAERGSRRDDDRPPRRSYRDDDRPAARRPRRDDDRPARGPRRDDDRPPRRSYRDDDRPAARRPRRDDDRPARGSRRDDDRPARGPRRDDDRPPRRSYRDDDAPMSEAQRRSAQVKRRTGGRVTSGEMSRRPERSRVEWVDEGAVGGRRRRAEAPATSGGFSGGARRAKGLRALDSVVEEFEKTLGKRSAPRAIKRYEAALVPFEAHRYDEARKILLPMAREYDDVAAVHEMLGLCLYRGGNWAAAARELERSLEINPRWVFNHAVLADCQRAVKNFKRVDELWEELAAASPSAEITAEGRIVYAASLADRGDLDAALEAMATARSDNGRPAEHHLRQWYVIADLHDRMGDVIQARNFFERILKHDAGFADVVERLASLGS